MGSEAEHAIAHPVDEGAVVEEQEHRHQETHERREQDQEHEALHDLHRVRSAQRCEKGRGLAAEATEETAFLLRGGILLFGMVLIAPLIRGHLFPHRVNVLAAALPGGLSAYLTGGRSTHDCLLR